LAFASKTGAQVSRLWFLTWAALTFFLFIIERLSLRSLLKFLRANGWDTKRIVLIGEGSVAARAYQTVLKSPQAGLNFLGYFRVSQEQDELRGLLPHLGGRDDLGQIVDLRPDQTWIALPNGSQDEILEVLYRLRHATSDLLVIPAIDEYLLSRQVIEIAGVPVVQVGSVAPGGIAWMLKGLTDRVAAFILLVFFSPLFCMIAVAVLLSSPGPVLFRQARHGLGGKEFNIYKFRTMYVAKETADGYQQASQVDPRITPLGSFLRRTSLDEIPQVFNVLLGSMSMVGPRPHPVQMNRIYQEKIERYMWRHKIKPGITGWAQINGMRGETDTLDKLQKRVEYDLYYIKHWSYWLDIKILWLTLFRVFRDPMAY
jgi:Undecaprenyl-phosphate glucose phosphotransferase